MRILFLLSFLVALSVAADSALPASYEDGRTYIYDYSATALSGILKMSPEMSGFHLKGSVALTALGDQEFNLVLSAKMARIQRDISPMDPRSCGMEGPLDWDEKRSFKLKGWPTMEKKIKLPLMFKWKPCGHVSKVFPHPDDEQWSLDLKKGVVGMLSGEFASMNKSGGMFDKKDEENVDGKCRTSYIYTEPDENGVREATRIRDLSGCTEAPTFRHSLFSSLPCEEGGRPDTINWVQGETSTEYNVTTGKDNFMILDAQTCSMYGVTPPGQKEYGMTTFVEQYLNFNKDKEASEKEMMSETLDEGQSLQLQLMGGFGRPKPKSQTKVVAKIETLLKAITEAKKPAKLHDKLDEVVGLLRSLSEEDLQKVWDATSKFAKRRNHLVNVLSATGTEESLQLVMKLVREGTLSDPDSAQMLRLSVIAALPSANLMNDMIILAKDDVDARAKPLTFRAAWLAAGTAIGKIFSSRGGDEQIAEKVVKLATAMAMRPVTPSKYGMSAEERDVLLLMTVGNTGIPQLMKLIKKKLAPENSVTVRLAAVKALHKMAPLPGTARAVRRILFGLLADPEVDIEVRINAYLVLIKARPSRFHLSIFADLLRKEPSEHLRSFISSHLRLLARLRRPSSCVATMARYARRLLRSLPMGGYEGPSRFRSRAFYMPLSKALGMGVYGAIIYGKESTLPRSLTLGLRGVFEQNLVNFAEISFRSNETDDLLRGFFGPAGKMYSWLGGKIKMQDLFSKPVKPDPSKPISDIGTSITYSLFGENLFQYNSNSIRKAQILKGMFPSTVATFFGMMMKNIGKGVFQDLMSWDRTIYMDSNNVVASTAGIPITFDIIHSSHRKGYVKAKMANPTGVGQLKTKTGVSYRLKVMFGLEIGDKWTHVASTMDMALFPGRTSPMTWTMAMQLKNIMKGKMSQLMYLNRPEMPLRLFQASVKLHIGSSDSEATKLTPVGREMQTEKMDGRAMQLMGIKFRGEVTRPVRLRRVMDGWEDFLSTKNLLSTPMEMKIEMEDTAKAKKAKNNWGMQMNFLMDVKRTKKPHPMANYLPKRTKPVVETLRDVKSPKDMKMKPATKPYLDMPAQPSEIIKEFVMTLKMLNMELLKNGEMKYNKGRMELGRLTAQFQGKGFYEVQVRTVLKNSWRLRGVMGSVGAPATYNPSNPFTITTNAKHFHKFILEDLQNQRELTSGNSEWSISKWWVNWWKKMIKMPDQLRKNWPDIAQCIEDLDAKQKKDSYPDSVSCFRAWEMLNTYDKVTVVSKSSRYMQFGMPSDDMPLISDMFDLFFTDMDVTANEDKKERTMEAWLSPTDRRTMRLRTTLKSWLRRLSYEKCEVDFYPSPNAVYVRTFDGAFYTVPAAKAGTAGTHVVLAEDRRRGLFSVSLMSKGVTQVRFRMGAALCMIEIRRNKAGKAEATKGEGNACMMAKVTEGSDRTDGVRVTVRILQFSVSSNGDSITEISVGPFYHDSLQGVCGDLDREPDLGEFLGGSCANPQYFEDPEELVAHFSKKGDPKLPTSCDM